MVKGLLLVLALLFAVPAVAQAGLWVGPVASYVWHSDADFNDYSLRPALAVGFDGGALELKVSKVLDVRESYVGDWLKAGPYRADLALKFRF